MKKYHLAVFIGRFQPFHDGHMRVVKHALELADEVLILVGSANRARSLRNPFTYEERHEMVTKACFVELDGALSPIHIVPLGDHTYDDTSWVAEVQAAVASHSSGIVSPNVCLVGNDKDATTYYLKLFPQWDHVPCVLDGVDATIIRTQMFQRNGVPEGLVPPAVHRHLQQFDKGIGDMLCREYESVQAYRKQWGEGPFVTVDAVVVQGGHVLLVRRGDDNGKGLLALPGGFLEPSETLLDGAIRELAEETGLDASSRLRMSFVAARAFDDPHRSSRARIVTHAHLFDLSRNWHGLPDVKGADDAVEAMWVPLSELRMDRMYDDHGFIVQRMIAQLGSN